MDKERVKLYFERVGLAMPEEIVPDAALLKKLLYHAIISIPYENTQFLKREITPCDTDSLFQRIVIEKKGGICHDINGLLGWCLEELGYKVVPVGCYSYLEKLRTHIHRTLIVTDMNGDEWLTDSALASFIDCKDPIRFVPGLEQTFGSETFRIEETDGKFCLLGPSEKGSFRLEHWDLPREVGTRIKELTIDGSDPAGPVVRSMAIGTPEGYRSLIGNSYKECFGAQVYKYQCTPETLPWAFAQFGLAWDGE